MDLEGSADGDSPAAPSTVANRLPLSFLVPSDADNYKNTSISDFLNNDEGGDDSIMKPQSSEENNIFQSSCFNERRHDAFVCIACPSHFVRQDRLRFHYYVDHWDKTRFNCSDCDEEFPRSELLTDSSNLYQHKCIHNDNNHLMGFTTRDPKQHVPSHQTSATPPSRSLDPERKSQDQFTFESTMTSQTPKTPEMNTRNSLLTPPSSEKISKNSFPVDKPEMEVTESSAYIDRNRRPSETFVCTLCSRRFSSRRTLSRHYSSLHALEMPKLPFKCSDCGVKFDRSGDMRQPQRDHCTNTVAMDAHDGVGHSSPRLVISGHEAKQRHRETSPSDDDNLDNMPLMKRLKLNHEVRVTTSDFDGTQVKRRRYETPSSNGDSVDDMPLMEQLRSWKRPTPKPEGPVEDLSRHNHMQAESLYGPLTDADARQYYQESRDMLNLFTNEFRNLQSLHQRYFNQITNLANRVRRLESDNVMLKCKINDLEYYNDGEDYGDEDYQEGDD